MYDKKTLSCIITVGIITVDTRKIMYMFNSFIQYISIK